MIKNILKKIVCLAITLQIVSCSYQPSSAKSCELWAEISKGEYLLTNNVWGAKNQKGFEQCISFDMSQMNKPNDSNSITQPTFAWQWKWLGENDHVLAYPSLLFGHKPWNETSTTKALPLKIETIDKITVEYDITQMGTGSHNVLLESWVTSSKKPNPATRTAEIAIHLSQQNWPEMPGKLIKTVSIDGELYDFYVDPAIEVPEDDLRWPYLGFVYKGHRVTHGKLDLSAFVHFLMAENYVNPEHYLVSVELGSELIKGEGEAIVKKFSVQF